MGKAVVAGAVLLGVALLLGVGRGASSPLVVQRAFVHTGNSHGRFVVTSAALLQIARPRVTVVTAEEEDQDPEAGQTTPQLRSYCEARRR